MAGFFSPETLEQIRAANDIVDVIGSYLPLKRAGANFVALCPFHREKSPSFNVNPHRQIFHCFGCHKGGDVFTFVKEYESIDFPEAVQRLAERAKIPLEYTSGGGVDHAARDLKNQLLEIHEQIAQRWQNALANDVRGQIARDYLVKRGVSAEAVQFFRLGYAPDPWDDTVNWARSKGHDMALMEKAGLVLHKEGTDRFYDRFRGRLMFPICDEQGRVVGFSGRVLSGDEKTAKYVNSPETPIFIKSKVFFGLDKSKRAILDAGYAIVCEGQLDLISCFMGGVQNMVAPQGTAFTAEHARILKRYVDEVVLCFDSDSAGQNAAVRALDHLLAAGLAVRVAVVPEPHDPDSFIKANGGAAFKQLVENAAGFFDYYLNRLCSTNEVGSDRGRLVILRSMAEAVHKTQNGVLIDKYAQKTALRLGVAPNSVREEFKKLMHSIKPPLEAADSAYGELAEPGPESEPALEPPTQQEAWLLKLLLLHDELVPWAVVHLDPNWILHRQIRAVVSQRLLAQAQSAWQSLPAFLEQIASPGMRNLVTEILMEKRPIPNPERLLLTTVQRLRDLHIDRELAQLTAKLGQPGAADEEYATWVRRKDQLRAAKREPLTELPAP